MLEPRNIAKKRLNAETHRIIGETQLQYFGRFLDDYHKQLTTIKLKYPIKINLKFEPILLDCEKYECTSILQLVHSDNKLLSRILASLASICLEIRELVIEANEYYNFFAFFGEDTIDGKMTLQSTVALIEMLQKVYCFVERSQQVINLLFKQLCAILGKENTNVNNAACFPELLECLSELLVCLLIFDCLLCLPIINNQWVLYRQSVKSVLHNPSKVNCNLDQLRALDKNLEDLEVLLLNGNIYKKSLEKCLNDKLILTIKNSLSNEIIANLNHLLNELEKDENNIFYTELWLQANCLLTLEYYLFGITDKKIIKRLLEINKKISACTLISNIVWYPEEFLLKHIPVLNKLIDINLIENYRLIKISNCSQNLSKNCHTLLLQACYWIIEICRITKKNLSKLDIKELQECSNLLIDGLKLVKKINEIIKWITNLYADKGKPMIKSVLLNICKLVEILKCIQSILKKKLMPLIYTILLISQHLSHKALKILNNIKKGFKQDKSYKEQQLDVISALNICEQSLKRPNTIQRLLIIKLSLSATGLNYDDLNEIRSIINQLEVISFSYSILNKFCNCSFLYWYQLSIMPIYFSKLLETKSNLSKYYLLIEILNDSIPISEKLTNELSRNCIKQNLIDPLNQIIETNLRLQTHLHLQMPLINETFNCNFFKIKPTLLNREFINLKRESEYYLSYIFYNLTTVVLHDWKTYGEMRRLAYLQYGLNTIEDNLPIQTLEQGLDVLEIMRNINTFVGKYLYNLNNQVFIEESSNNKHLNTINISHVANSIRTHGIGIMNTTVNFIYQFLQKKFYIFSQFMFDEHIKSRLLKDIRYFNENKNDLLQMYPYERAEKFNITIRNLGLNQNGLTYLDLFRKLITQIGNAMGYIRLIKSGGRRCLADGTCFIPNLKEIHKLNEYLLNDELPELIKQTTQYLINDLKCLVDNFEEATEYFKLLVKVFLPVFQNITNIHLKNFFIIVPPLTINFIEYILTCKEHLNKNNKLSASFTDDGFAMGLAYIIELLQQEQQLNSLHWFPSVQAKFLRDRKKIQKQITEANKQDEKLQQTLTLSEKRVNSFEKEFQLFYYNFSSARIFFQT